MRCWALIVFRRWAFLLHRDWSVIYFLLTLERKKGDITTAISCKSYGGEQQQQRLEIGYRRVTASLYSMKSTDHLWQMSHFRKPTQICLYEQEYDVANSASFAHSEVKCYNNLNRKCIWWWHGKEGWMNKLIWTMFSSIWSSFNLCHCLQISGMWSICTHPSIKWVILTLLCTLVELFTTINTSSLSCRNGSITSPFSLLISVNRSTSVAPSAMPSTRIDVRTESSSVPGKHWQSALWNKNSFPAFFNFL